MRGCVQDVAPPIFVAAFHGHQECIAVLAGLGGDVNKAKNVSVEGLVESAVVVAGVALLSWVSWYWVLMCMM